MRISTAMQYQTHLNYLQTANSKVDKASQQYNTGLKFQTAGENPAGQAAKIKYQADIAAYQQYSINASIVADNLAQEETALSQIWDALSSVQTRLIQATNGTMDDGARAALAEDMKQTQAQIFDLMNSKNAEGEYIFSGATCDVPTYTLTSDGRYVCQADGSNKMVVVSPTNKVQTTDSGLNIFENNQLARTFAAKEKGNPPFLESSGISDYDQFASFYKEQYNFTAKDIVAGNTLSIKFDDKGNFTLYRTNDGTGKAIDKGVIKDGNFTVMGMEFTFPEGYDIKALNDRIIQIQLEPPEQDNILNQLTGVINMLTVPKDEWAAKDITNSSLAAELSRMQVNVELSKKQVDSYRGLVGARGAHIEEIIRSDQALSDIKKEANANVTEADAFTAVSDLVQSQNALQVAQQSYQIVHSSTLFDFI